MNKKILLSSVIVLSALLAYNLSYAADAPADVNKKHAVQLHKKMPPPIFKGECKDGFRNMHPPFHSKEEMEAKRAEIDKRLNLTEEQKTQIEQNREKDRAKIKPVIEKIHADRKALHEIYSDEKLTQAEKDKKAEKIKKDLVKQKAQADKSRKENMKKFEAILTPEQKVEFEKIKQEQKAEMEKRKTEFEQKKKEFENKPPFEAKPPVQPPPPKVEK